MTLRVLLVEDDADLRATLRAALQVDGHDVFTAASLAEGLALLTHAGAGERGFDVVLLDLALPDGDGEKLLALLRRSRNWPVLVISARDAIDAKIRLLDAGADDYLIKPFSVAELLARMRVAVRHRGTSVQPAVTRYARQGVEIDLSAQHVQRDGAHVHLTPTEFKLLACLVRQAGQVVTHRRLLATVWGAEHVEDTHYLRLYMAQLRAKLEADPADPQLLLTEPGVGYRLTAADDASS
jgi:two-component system KDP operon response regulator KdpE